MGEHPNWSLKTIFDQRVGWVGSVVKKMKLLMDVFATSEHLELLQHDSMTSVWAGGLGQSPPTG